MPYSSSSPRLALAFAFILISTCAFAKPPAKTINVPATQPTIQAGINAAANGDTVLVAPGTYKENLDFTGKNITVTSSGGPATTIIDGQALGAVVTFQSSERAAAVLSGFTLQNSNSSGAVYIPNGSPTIQNNVMILNEGYTASAVYLVSGSPVIKGNLIHDNGNAPFSFTSSSINISSVASAQIVGNAIFNNAGAAILDYGSGSTISYNVIHGNGSGITLEYGSASPSTITQNLITGNLGVGMYAAQTNIIAVNNTITGNTISPYSPESSELWFNSLDSSSTLYNNLIVAQNNGPGMSCDSYNASAPPVFANNDVFATANVAYGIACPTFTGSSGNISADPLFAASLSNDFHLSAGSPSIDAGNNAAPGLPSRDFDGNARSLGAAVDIGVDEYSRTIPLALSSYVLAFGTQAVGGSSPPQSLTLSNNGNAAITLTSIVTGSDFTQTNNCGSSLASGATCLITLTFSPVGGGERAGVLAIFSSASSNPRTATLSGSGLAPVVSISNPYPFFYDQVVGTASSQQSTITNTGSGPLTISAITVSGSTSFSQTSNCPFSPATLAPSASCVITITYLPVLGGITESATISIVDNALPSPQTVGVTGVSVSAGVASVSPSALTFPDTYLGSTSAPLTLTLTNVGTGPLGAINLYTTSSDFPETNNCPASLAVNASCTITITFSPTLVGSDSAYLQLFDDSANYYTSINISGNGISGVPVITAITPNNFPVGQIPYVTITGSGFNNMSQVQVNGTVVCSSYCNYGLNQISFYYPGNPPPVAGTVTVTVVNPAPGGSSNPVMVTIYNPFTYAIQSTPYVYRAITGTNLNLYYAGYAQITSPFPIPFGGGSATTLTVSSSGAISFTGYNEFFPNGIPNSSYDEVVAPFWDYLFPTTGNSTNNNVFWQVNGTAPNRELVVEWRNVSYCCTSTSTLVTFEVVFQEATGNILYIYKDTVFGGVYASHDNGATASVGVQSTSNLGTQYSYNTPSLASRTALLLYPSNPTPTLSTSVLNFGYHLVGTKSNAQRVTLTNGSTAELDISSITTSSSHFTQTNTCGSALLSGKSCTITVYYTPTQPGAESAILTVAHNGTNSPQTVTLNGTGSATNIEVFPNTVNFGTVAVGQSSAAMPVTLANASNAALSIQSISITGMFSQTNNCGASLPAGASCTVNVAFNPTQQGSAAGSLLMALNGRPAVKESALSGVGK